MARIRSLKPETPLSRWDRASTGPDAPGGALLYRLLAKDGTLLYIGVTGNPVERWRSHAQRKTWWPQVATIEVEDHSRLRNTLEAERRAIRQEHPVHNRRSAVA
jgi:predicted GIY-YIG superfamily endonuclease